MGQNALFDEYRSPLHVLSSRVLIVALVPGLVGLASEHWLTATSGWVDPGESGQIRHLGLWAVCNNVSRCASLPSSDFPDAYGPVRGLGVTSLCLHVLSVMVGLVCSCEDPDNLLGVNVYVPRLEEILAVVAGILMGGALGIFAQTTQQHPVYRTFQLSWSYWLLLVYVCFLLLAGGVIVLVRNKCACPGKCRRLRHRQQTTRCLQTAGEQSAKNNWIERSLKETHLKFFVEPFKDNTGPGCFDGSTKVSDAEHSSNLERMSGYVSVYSSLEGIPRMLEKLSGKPEETDTV